MAESKRFGRQLDAREPGRTQTGTPHGQILRYLRTANDITDGRLRWGILTDGGVWRLYDQRARPRATGYFEADLAALLRGAGRAPSPVAAGPAPSPSTGEGRGEGDPGTSSADALRTFFLLFNRRSFVLRPGATATFLETALAEGRRYEQQVAQDLSGVVFERAFPNLIGALLDAGGASLADARQAALILLYRLLFVLYAEDRGLLPVNDDRYDDYGLRKRVRDDIARRMDAGDTFSSRAGNYYDRVMTLAGLIDTGDDSIGLPPYNGGLFAPDAAPLLDAVRLSGRRLRPHRSRPESRRDRRPAAVRQLPRHVGATAGLDLRAPAGAGAGAQQPGRHRDPPQSLRAQGQRQLLYAAGAGGPDP